MPKIIRRYPTAEKVQKKGADKVVRPQLACEKCPKMVKDYWEMGEGAGAYCKMDGHGPQSRIMLVGEAPGYEEAQTGEPFVGPAGRYLRKQLLNQAGITATAIRITNAVRCRPKGNRAPTAKEVANCREYLVQEIAQHKPALIVAAGGTAWSSLTNQELGAITQWQGKQVWSQEFNCWLLPILHPSHIMRNRYEYDIFRTIDFLRDGMQMATDPGVLIRPEPIATTYISQPGASYDLMMDKLEESDTFAIDLEAANPEKGVLSRWWADPILGVALSMDGKRGYYVSWKVIADHPKNEERFRALLADKDKVQVYQNCSFDVKFLWHALNGYGFEIGGKVRDTLLAHHLLDEGFAGQHGLKQLAWRYTMYGGYDLPLQEALEQAGGLFQNVPEPVLAQYGAMDATVTFQLWELFKDRLESGGLMELYESVVMPARGVLNKMEYRGIALNVEYLEKMGRKMEADQKLLRGRLAMVAGKKGMKDFNPDSTNQLRELLFNKLKLKSVKETGTGLPSTDEEVLTALTGKHPAIQTLLDYRKVQKLQSTYVVGMTERAVDGRVHTGYLSHGTVTGRLSSAGPNLQNIPRDADMKTIFRATPGYRLVDADFSQAELRGIAHYSKDPFMLQMYKEDKDIHTMVAMELYGLKEDEITKEQRTTVKAINFGIAYGQGPRALAEALKITEDEAREYLRKYFQRFPKVRDFIDRTVKEARRQGGVITNLFGRKRRVPEVAHDDEYLRAEAERMVVNSLIQGTIADMTNMALVRIDRAFGEANIDAYPLLQVHDSIVCEAKAEEVEEASRIVKKCMEEPYPGFTVPMRADVDISDLWGEHGDSLGVVWRDYNKLQ